MFHKFVIQAQYWFQGRKDHLNWVRRNLANSQPFCNGSRQQSGHHASRPLLPTDTASSRRSRSTAPTLYRHPSFVLGAPCARAKSCHCTYYTDAADPHGAGHVRRGVATCRPDLVQSAARMNATEGRVKLNTSVRLSSSGRKKQANLYLVQCRIRRLTRSSFWLGCGRPMAVHE